MVLILIKVKQKHLIIRKTDNVYVKMICLYIIDFWLGSLSLKNFIVLME